MPLIELLSCELGVQYTDVGHYGTPGHSLLLFSFNCFFFLCVISVSIRAGEQKGLFCCANYSRSVMLSCRCTVTKSQCILTGAHHKERTTAQYSCHGVFTDRFIFRLNFPQIWDSLRSPILSCETFPRPFFCSKVSLRRKETLEQKKGDDGAVSMYRELPFFTGKIV